MTTMTPEFSRIYRLSDVNDHPVFIEALAKERVEIAKRLALKEVRMLNASFEVFRQNEGHYLLKGEFNAHVVAETLEEAEVRQEPLLVHVLETGVDFQGEKDIFVDVDYSEEGMIDVGEIIVQYVSLALTP